MTFQLSLLHFLLLAFLLHPVRSDDTTSQLFQGINKYRASLNLSSLTDNQNADCLAEQLAQQFKGQDCTNTTGVDTVPGTEQQFPNYLDLLSKCHLNATVTQDGTIMPACVPGLVPDIVLSNYTKSQYSEYLNDSSFAGIGMADEGNWVVVILTTATSTGNFASVTSAGVCVAVAVRHCFWLLLLGLSIVLTSL